MKLEKSVIVQEIGVIAFQIAFDICHNGVKKEVDSFDAIQRIQDVDAFEARTGIVLSRNGKQLA